MTVLFDHRGNRMQARSMEPQSPTATHATDAFQNTLARLGFQAPNLLEGTEYPLTRLTRNYILMNSLYRSHWIVRKIIDTMPEDMSKNWYQIMGEIDPEQIDAFQRMERRTQTRAKFLQAMKWGRLYGGAAAIIMIEGHEGILNTPLDLDAVLPDSYKGLLVLDRWSGITPAADQIEDINDPDFGLPSSYRVTTETGRNYDVHSSRVLRFIGRDLPYWEKQAEVHWGISEIEVVFDELKKRDNTSWNIASLVFLANIRVFKMGKLGQMLSSGTAQVQQQVYNAMQAMNWLMSNSGIQVIDKDDDFDTKQFTFSGLSDMYQNFMLDLCGATEYPMTKLFGRSPSGLSSTGEYDEQNYYDLCGEKQEQQMRPQLEKLLPVQCMSVFGQVPSDIDIKFNPPQTVKADKLADLAARKTSSVVEVFNSGLCSQKTAMQELRQMSDETGMWTNITDDDIAKADDELKDTGEMFGGAGGFGDLEGAMEGKGVEKKLRKAA